LQKPGRGLLEQVENKIRTGVVQLSLEHLKSQDESVFLQGGYSRGAAILFYLSQPLKLIGDGPSRYYDPSTREYSLGNTGQIFTRYSEIGLVGLITSFWILYKIGKSVSFASTSMRIGTFLVICALTLTSSVMSDASIMLAYNIFLRTNLLSMKPRISDQQ
jgi:hypothetical protein